MLKYFIIKVNQVSAVLLKINPSMDTLFTMCSKVGNQNRISYMLDYSGIVL
jgi:hypothetical protein